MISTFAVEVRGLTPALLQEGVEFVDEVVREVQLAGSAAVQGLAEDLTGLLARIYGAGDGREQMIEAFRGDAVDVDLHLPVGAELDLVHLGLLLDRIDAACRDGLLLSLPRTPAVARMNWWSITEVVRQRHGLPPTAFPA